MCGVVIQQAENVRIPEWVTDVTSFTRWAGSDEFPVEGRIDYLAGEIWVDMSEEQLFTHVRVKAEFCRVLTTLEREERQGFYLVDGARISYPEVHLSAKPDGVFVLNDSIQTMRVQLIQGKSGGYVRIAGGPDMVLEVLSDSSVDKDTVRLKEVYWKAGVHEYWLVDARKEPLTFDILRHTAKGYVAVRKQGGWLKSSVLGKSFRLTQQPDPLGNPAFTLEVR